MHLYSGKNQFILMGDATIPSLNPSRTQGSKVDSERTLAWDALSWRYAARHVRGLHGLDGLVRSARYWLAWNNLVEQHATATFRIEDLNPKKLVEALALPSTRVRFDPRKLGRNDEWRHGLQGGHEDLDLSAVPDATAIRAASHAATSGDSTSKGRVSALTWAALEAGVGHDLALQIRAAAQRYGYTT